MKKGIILALFAAFFGMSYASNKTAIDYYESGDLNKAKTILSTSSNLDAMDCYYLGMIYLKENNKSAATETFNKGLKLDPANSYNSVGLSAVKMSADAKTASKELTDISKTYKKDPKMLVAIAEAFAIGNDKVQMNMFLDKAKKADKKSALPYIFEGEQLMAQGNNNEAAVRFETALYFDPNSKIALVKLAQLYVGTRKQIAFDYLNKAVKLDPNYEYGWITQADLLYKNGFYPEAKIAFEKYMSLIKPQPEDYQTYGEILYFNKDYNGALNALANAPVNTVTNRLKFYSMFELNRFDEALPLAQALINTTNPSELIWQDYNEYAQLLNKTKDYSNAAKYYELAYQKDTTKLSTLADVAKTYEKALDYPSAVKYYQKVIDKNPNLTLGDLYALGTAYYSAGTNTTVTPDATQRMSYLQKANDTFAKIVENFPDNYLGYLLQARANSAMDPETTKGLAKPYYEKALEMMLPNQTERKKDILEVYQYLGIYYLKTDNYPQSRAYWVKVLELDPTNSIAQEVIKSIDSSKKKK
jgi:tetratricopeptide (TPR) repeat protein